jgi:hypothetical protein
MNKPLFGLALGGFLGIFDGLSALVSAPEVAPDIVGIVIGSTFKGLLAGVLIGVFARKVQSLPLGILFGLAVGLFFAYLIAAMPDPSGKHYYWEIMLPGGLLGTIVGYATQKWRSGSAPTAVAGAAVLIAALAVAGTPAAAAPPAALDGKAAFARLKTLAGQWEGNITKPDGPPGAVRYELTAGGSVVKETQFPGTSHEMLTVYHLEGNDLVLTHYCATGNQPRMKMKTATEEEVVFEYAGAGVPQPALDTHMHAARHRFVGPDRIESEWTLHAKGQEADVARLFLSRKK